MPERIHHDGGRVFTISGSLACIPVQCFIKDNDNFLDSVYSSEPDYNYPVSSWRNGSRRCAMSTNTAKLKLQLAPNYQCKVSKIIDTDFNSGTEIFRSGNLFQFVEIEGYMGDSINSLSIVPIPTAFIDGSVKAVTGDAFEYIDGDIICAVNAEHSIDGEVIVLAPVYTDIDGDITLNIARAEMECWFEVFDEGGGWI